MPPPRGRLVYPRIVTATATAISAMAPGTCFQSRWRISVITAARRIAPLPIAPARDVAGISSSNPAITSSPPCHPMKTGRITPTREGVADRSRSDEVNRPSPDHHAAECDRKPDHDEFVYRHGRLLLVLLASGLAGLRRLAKRRHGTDLAEDVECVELIPVLNAAPVLDP